MMLTLSVLLIVAFVVPLAVLLPLVIAAVVVAAVLLAVAGVLSVVFSPLILLALGVWLIVKLARSGRGNGSRRPADATIAG
jgi:hypothetical protein